MSAFDPQLAEIRFGYGLSPLVSPPSGAEDMLQRVGIPDPVEVRFEIETFPTFRTRMVAAQAQMDIRRKNRGTDMAAAAIKQRRLINKAARQEMARWLGQDLLRRSYTRAAFRERLVAFWGDHFSAQGKRGVIRRGTSPYLESAIRPHIAGRFADLLQAAILSPLMLHYLDQATAIGPNSTRAAKRKKASGLNENLAREVLELHTLGVDGPYDQEDVRQLAELFTGLSFQAQNGFKFRKDFVEPGPETVLGRTYPDEASLRPIRMVLEDLATHPATARHIAHKLAVHFSADVPEPDLVRALAARFFETEGDLLQVYAALLDHPAAWRREMTNFKPPDAFLSSALRALGVPSAAIAALDENATRALFTEPLAQMGQVWQRPEGPDGWPEEDGAWVTPQGLSWRIRWAMSAPEQLRPDLPDPRDFVETALGGYAPEPVRFAAAAAESRPEAIGLVLVSPAFQRR